MSSTHTQHQSHQRRIVVEIDKRDLEAGIRQVVIDRGRFVVGRVRRRHSTGEIRFIIDRFQTVNSIPSGNRMPALSDSVVLTCTFRGTPQIEHVPEIVQAARSQLWVFLMLDHRFNYFHAIWHVLVIAASACHFYAILKYVVA